MDEFAEVGVGEYDLHRDLRLTRHDGVKVRVSLARTCHVYVTPQPVGTTKITVELKKK